SSRQRCRGSTRPARCCKCSGRIRRRALGLAAARGGCLTCRPPHWRNLRRSGLPSAVHLRPRSISSPPRAGASAPSLHG
ncbi:unnamed protein product, partial [Effrenium voratum]